MHGKASKSRSGSCAGRPTHECVLHKSRLPSTVRLAHSAVCGELGGLIVVKRLGRMAAPFASRGGFTGYFEQAVGSSFGHSRTSFERGRPLVNNGSTVSGQRSTQPPSQRNLQLFRNSPQALSARAEHDFLRDQQAGPAADLLGHGFQQVRVRAPCFALLVDVQTNINNLLSSFHSGQLIGVPYEYLDPSGLGA